MAQIHQLFIYALLCLALAFSSCKPEPIETPKPADWQLAPGFGYEERIAYNSAVWDDQLFVVTGNFLHEVKPNGESVRTFHSANIAMPLPVNRNFFVAVAQEPDELAFIPTANPSNTEGKRIKIKLSDLAPDIAGLSTGFNRWLIADNGKGQVLVILRTYQNRQMPFLFEVKMKKNQFWDVEEVTATRINLSEYNIYIGISVVEDRFLVGIIANTGENETLQIDASGTVSKVASDAITKIMPVGDTLFAEGSSNWFTSVDQGNSWNIIPGNNVVSANPALSDLGLLQGHTVVDGRLIIHTGLAILQINRTPTGKLERTALDLSGLEGNRIINVHAWRDQVFAVTLTGVYMRSTKDFFTKS